MAFLTQLFRFVKLELSIGNDFYHSDCDTSMADQRNHSLKMNCVANGKHHRPCSMLVTLALLFLVILFGFGNEMLLYRYYCTSENYFMHLWLESIFGSICIYLVMMNLQYPLDQCNFRYTLYDYCSICKSQQYFELSSSMSSERQNRIE